MCQVAPKIQLHLCFNKQNNIMMPRNLSNTLTIFFFLLVSISAFGQKKTEGIHMDIQQRTNEIFDSLVTIRRDFHMYPEVGGNEKRTSEKIAA